MNTKKTPLFIKLQSCEHKDALTEKNQILFRLET